MKPLDLIPTRRRSHRAIAVAAATISVIGAGGCADDGAATPTTQTSTVTLTETTTGTTTNTTTGTTTDTTTNTTTNTATNTATIPDQSEVPTTTASPAVVDVAVLTDDDVAGLLWMREEEQLAHDVYVALGDEWGLRIFENIAASETTHIDAVVGLLDAYGIDDPARGNEPGTFTDPTMQAMYDELVADGRVSLDAALSVGALIEELDISDLMARSAATDVAQIADVYAGLERGSRNHLRAFTSQLESRGIDYRPTQLDQAAFDAIVAGGMERGPDA